MNQFKLPEASVDLSGSFSSHLFKTQTTLKACVQNVCRICFMYIDEEKVNLFSKEPHQLTSPKDIIFNLFHVEYKEDASLPSLICKQCIDALTYIRDFRQLVLDSEEFLQSYKCSFGRNTNFSPGLNGYPGEFEPPKNCNVIVINPEDDTQTSNDELSSDDENNDTISEPSKKSEATINPWNMNPPEQSGLTSKIDSLGPIPEFQSNDQELPPTNNTIFSLKGMTTTTGKANRGRKKAIKEKFLCKYCDVAFRDLEDCQEHELEHGSQAPYTCYLCISRYDNIQDMIKHIRTHHDSTHPFFCVLCGKSFSQRAGLKKHVVVHLDAKHFNCPQCGEEFSRNINLIRHQVVHKPIAHLKEILNSIGTGATLEKTLPSEGLGNKIPINPPPKPNVSTRSSTQTRFHACEVCGKNFTRERDLNSHRAIHLDTLFNCKRCGERFNRREKLMRHERTVHKPMTITTTTTKDSLQLQRHDVQEHNVPGTWPPSNSSIFPSQQINSDERNFLSSSSLAGNNMSNYPVTRRRLRSITSFSRGNDSPYPSLSSSTMNLGFYSETNTNNQDL